MQEEIIKLYGALCHMESMEVMCEGGVTFGLSELWKVSRNYDQYFPVSGGKLLYFCDKGLMWA